MALSIPRPSFPGGSRRALAAQVAQQLGILQSVRHLRLNRGLIVLAYHRVGQPSACPVDGQLMSVTASGLVSHMGLLQRWTRICSLDEVAERYACGGAYREPLSLVTFDDTYRDNYEVAFPLLRKVGVPAVFFAPTGLLECRHIPWWDRIAYAVKHTRHDTIRLDYPAELEVTGLRQDPAAATLVLLRRYKRDADLDKERFIQAVEAAAEARAADTVGELFATWDMLREMSAGGMTIASHTHTHRLLGHLSYHEQYEELMRSRAELRAHLQVETSAVAYPVGQRRHFNEDTRRALRELGYTLGFSHYGGWNAQPEDPYDVRRIRVDAGFTLQMLKASLAVPALFVP